MCTSNYYEAEVQEDLFAVPFLGFGKKDLTQVFGMKKITVVLFVEDGTHFSAVSVLLNAV